MVQRSCGPRTGVHALPSLPGLHCPAPAIPHPGLCGRGQQTRPGTQERSLVMGPEPHTVGTGGLKERTQKYKYKSELGTLEGLKVTNSTCGCPRLKQLTSALSTHRAELRALNEITVQRVAGEL